MAGNTQLGNQYNASVPATGEGVLPGETPQAEAVQVDDPEAPVRRIDGSHSGIMGLPLYETSRLLRGAGQTPR